MTRLFTCFLLLLLYTTQCSAQYGVLDPSFGTGGKVTTDVNGYDDYVFAMVVQPDHKIITAGYTRQTDVSINVQVVRYNEDGSLDKTFNKTGKIMIDAPTFWYATFSVVLQKDGKIVLGGYWLRPSQDQMMLVRLNTDGSLDAGFGAGGIALSPLKPRIVCHMTAIRIQPDNKIIGVGGTYDADDYHINYDPVVLRFNSNGYLDSSFGTNGLVSTTNGKGDDLYTALILQPDGKILTGGYSQLSYKSDQEDAIMARYLPDGTPDSSFDADGFWISGRSDSDGIAAMGLQPDGKILASGHAAAGGSVDFALARYNSDGSPDPAFNSGNLALTDFSMNPDLAYAMVLQPDGKIVSGGYTIKEITGYDMAMARYNKDGTADLSFGTDGKVTTDFGSVVEQYYAMALQPDNKILAAGFTNNTAISNDLALARYSSGIELGVLDFNPGNLSATVYPNPVAEQATISYTLANTENISLRILDISGRVVRICLSPQQQTAGTYEQTLDFGNGLAAGTYIIELSNGTSSRKVKVVKG